MVGYRNNEPTQVFDSNDASAYWYYSRVYNKPIAQDNDQLMGG